MKRLLSIVAVTFFLVLVFGSSAIACMDGCTPGYWKQPQHADSWVAYGPDDLLSAVFKFPQGLELKNGTPLAQATLLDALKSGGGGLDAFLRHAVAALLNGSAIGCDFQGDGGVVAMVNALFDSESFTPGSEAMESLKDIFEAENDGFCPLN